MSFLSLFLSFFSNIKSKISQIRLIPSYLDIFPSLDQIDKELEQERKIVEIVNSDKFIEYENNFRQKKAEIYIDLDESELVIEMIKNNSYSVQRYKFDWSQDSEIDRMYEILDKLISK